MLKHEKVIAGLIVAPLVAGLAGFAYQAYQPSMIVATQECASARSAYDDNAKTLNGARLNGGERYRLETINKDLQNFLQASCAPQATATPSASPSASPSTGSAPAPTPTAPAPTGKYACRPTYYNHGNSVGIYAYGSPITQTTLRGILDELESRTWCDPALLVDRSHDYQVDTTKSMDEVARNAYSNQLAKEALAGDQATWDDLYNKFVAALEGANNELATIDPGTYMSRQMIDMGDGNAPRVAQVQVAQTAASHREVLKSTLPNGKIVNNRLWCGGQPQELKPSDVTVLNQAVPRNEEATPIKVTTPPSTPATTPASPVVTTTPVTTPTPTEEPTPAPTPTTPQVQTCTWKDGTVHPLNPDGTCPKDPGAAQPPGVEKPVDNPTANSAEPVPEANDAPLTPTPGTNDTGSNDSSTDGHTATETQVDTGADGIVSDG